MGRRNGEDVYQVITDKVLDRLESGTVPWRKPWTVAADGPRNIEGRMYRGLNVFLLLSAGYDSPYWMTFKQINERGGRIRKGEKSTAVIFWKRLVVAEKDDPEKKTVVPLLRFYNVWNLEQIDGINPPIVAEVKPEFTPIEAAEKVVANYPHAPLIAHEGGRAFYRPATDEITLPPKESFETPDAYYATAFHEMGHSTGHEKRLKRKKWASFGFGTHEYGREELVAEMTAAFLAGETGILPNTIDNSAAYLRSWIRTIGEDPRAVVWAAGQAQRAADHILGREATYQQEEE